MRARWILPIGFGVVMAGALLWSNAQRTTEFMATAEVRVPSVYVGSSVAEPWLSPSPSDEAAAFDADRTTEAIAAEYTGSLDVGSAAIASPRPETDSLIIIDVRASTASDARELADVASTVFAEQRQAEQLDSVNTELDGLAERSGPLRREIEQLVTIDLATRATDDPSSVTTGDTTPIQVIIEPLATQSAELDARIAELEQAASTIGLDGPTVSRAATVATSDSSLGVVTLLLLTTGAAMAGLALATMLRRREHRQTLVSAPTETDDDPAAWIDLFTAEADGVFIDLTTETAGWDSPTVEAAALASQSRTRALTALEAAEVFLAATGDVQVGTPVPDRGGHDASLQGVLDRPR